MMLRNRIKKLESTKPMGAADLISRWERAAMASLSPEKQVLLAECKRLSRSKRANSQAHLAAVQSYQDALAATITDVTDEELDGIIKSIGGAGTVASEVTA